MKALLPLILLLAGMFSARGATLSETRKISLIFVGPARGLSESSFGHVALKFSPEKSGGLLDLVIEFVADVPRDETPLKKYVRGAGLGKKYPVKAELSSFYDYRRKKTITENRRLTVYDLRLSAEEIQKVVDFIQNYQDRDVGDSYLFLTKNCSYFAAQALEEATGKKIKAKNFPWRVGKKLGELGLVADTRTFEDASTERMRLAEKFLREGLGEILPSAWTRTFSSMLGEEKIALRQSSYLKLLWLEKSKAPEKEKKRGQSLLRYLLSFESEVSQFTIRNLFKDPEEKEVISLPLIRLSEGKLPRARSIRNDLVIRQDKPVLELSWSGEAAATVRVPLKKLTFGEDLALKAGEEIVGRYIRTKSDRWVLSQRLDYGLDVDREAQTIRAFLYVDHSTNVKNLKLSYQALKEKGTVALNNAQDFKAEAGSCYALTLLQKAFLERAIFVPEALAQDIDKLRVLRELVAGNYVAIAGFKNVTEFTSSIPKEELKRFVREFQQSLGKGRLAQMRENILERELLDRVTEKRLKSILDEGLQIPLVIGMSEKGKLKPASDYAHVVLVHDMNPIPEGYRLTAYDPNTGLNSLYVLNKNFRLEYPFYDKNYDYVPLIDRIDAEALTLDHAVRSRGVDKARLIPLLKTHGILVLTPAEITTALL